MFQFENKKVWVAGHRGMVGSAIVRQLEQENCQILTTTRQDLNLLNQADVTAWMAQNKPDAIFVAAAKVGGILANDTYPADFLYENLMIEANIIHAAHEQSVEKLLFLGSSCIYPKFADQPIVEDSLLTGALEPTNEWYAIAKIAGIKLCEAYRRQHKDDFISAMPTNLYGPGDNYDLQNSHVIPALLRKAHNIKISDDPSQPMQVWGTGQVFREFMHADDCANALMYLMKNYSGDQHVNAGYGEDISIADLSQLVMDVVGLKGGLQYDTTKPDGTPKKLMDSAKLRDMGWAPKISLEQGLEEAYAWFVDNIDTARS